MFFKNLFKRFKDKKGATGGDVAVAITLIIVTLGVVTAIYVNVNNKIKENVRYSNSVRMATQIVENIQAKNYDYLINYCNQVNENNVYFKNVEGGSGEKIFEVNVPKGYTASIQSKRASNTGLDLVRDITVTVTYKIAGKTNSVSLHLVKEKEILEQTNKPDMTFINKNDSLNYYPIKYYNGSYYVTDENDPEWYNYDYKDYEESGTSEESTGDDVVVGLTAVKRGTYALVLETPDALNLGNIVEVGKEGTQIFTWIPRFGVDNDRGLVYCYGTSSYQIGYAKWTDFSGNVLYGYMLSGENLKTGTPDIIANYIENTFEVNDGLSGVWVNLTNTSSNTTKENTIKSEFEILCPNQNITF